MVRRRRQFGQSLAEYVLLVAIVSIGALAAIAVFGGNLQQAADTIANGNGNMGGIMGGGAPGGGNGPTGPNYPEDYAGDLAAAFATQGQYDPGSPKTKVTDFGLPSSICGTERGGDPVERCKRLQGEPITTVNPDGTETTEFADGTIETKGNWPDGSSYYKKEEPSGKTTERQYDADGNGFSEVVNANGTGVRTDTTVDLTAGTKTIVTTTTSLDGNGNLVTSTTTDTVPV